MVTVTFLLYAMLVIAPFFESGLEEANSSEK